MLKKNPKIFCGALYWIATANILGIWTLNLTNLSRNKDTNCHKRYHAGKKPLIIANRDDGRCTELKSVVEYYERDQIITHI